MSTNYRRIKCALEDVFRVLADGWVFPTWVVGASRMRDVDSAWPAVGSRLKHSFGIWPILINDGTTMLEWDPPRHAVMQPKGWPIGEALVTIDVRPRKNGCVVRLKESAVKGPATWLPTFIVDIMLHARNVETLRRLAFISEGIRDTDGATRVSGPQTGQRSISDSTIPDSPEG